MMHSFLLSAAVCNEGSAVNLDFVNINWFGIVILGIVQGITELLPISSTAHLRIVPSFLGLPDPGSAFSAAMQLASLTAVLTYFWQDITRLLGSSYRAILRKDYMSKSFRLLLGLIAGTIPIAIVGLLLKKTLDTCNSPLRTLVTIGIASIVMSLLLAAAEKWGSRKRNFEQLTLIDGVFVGIAQVFALIPGVSRSGSTITAALFLKMERETAAKFSFLLGLPTIILAGAVEMATLAKAGLDLHGWAILLLGLTSASISAFLAIFLLLKYLEKHSTWLFVWYRLAMGLFLLIGVGLGWLKN
ncbi:MULTISPECIES: undecaprenyl-diphosphate phosphatase [Pseudanabaena]|uniref:Undecaprenyl-diphosphatase n=2 Tax=Pseudanabaena TaxID=1152 RepID=L8MW33_9CYAN|nr:MULTISPECIES: undecaprenyl-diphosphate phosphatase [Pseudanabaena]ELS30670.1 Undecaprenyl-diphosphatase [Pseudanabaena biceps PCC 7429]MDG3497065.1 undecaprenyl-diphosphate phosphatase [Pseudanabaena catenata USMAC16]